MNHITRRIAWLGWLFAGLLLVQTAVTGLAAPSSISPLEGRLLQQSGGAFYVYHAGVKFPVQLADMGDQVLGAIPTATSSQWDTLFGGDTLVKPVPSGGAGPAGHLEPALPGEPAPFPAYS